ncbi:MAG: biotin--[Clostridia bacterium]|nr:biotin--[acetyl-CoA-carboxylase] ligase [Clostridia bacterium]
MIKDEVLAYLENNRGNYVSGALIATALGVSRNAVWKNIKTLEKEGYLFDKRTNIGYKLLESNDVLSAQGIAKYLVKGSNIEIEVYQSLNSTNDYVVAKAQSGAKEGLLVATESQSKGKGRLGRTFFSPSGGVYFSILLRPSKGAPVIEFLTTIAALSVYESIRELFGVNVGIKWVNDVYIGNKKCAGILTEASIDFETNSLAYAVIGIGINLVAPKDGYPSDIKDIACAIEKSIPDAKNKLIAFVVNKIMENYHEFNKQEVVERYKKGSIMSGRKLVVKRESGDREALCVGIDDECRLLVRYDSGEEETLYYGEVSLCLKG